MRAPSARERPSTVVREPCGGRWATRRCRPRFARARRLQCLRGRSCPTSSRLTAESPRKRARRRGGRQHGWHVAVVRGARTTGYGQHPKERPRGFPRRDQPSERASLYQPRHHTPGSPVVGLGACMPACAASVGFSGRPVGAQSWARRKASDSSQLLSMRSIEEADARLVVDRPDGHRGSRTADSPEPHVVPEALPDGVASVGAEHLDVLAVQRRRREMQPLRATTKSSVVPRRCLQRRSRTWPGERPGKHRR